MKTKTSSYYLELHWMYLIFNISVFQPLLRCFNDSLIRWTCVVLMHTLSQGGTSRELIFNKKIVVEIGRNFSTRLLFFCSHFMHKIEHLFADRLEYFDSLIDRNVAHIWFSLWSMFLPSSSNTVDHKNINNFTLRAHYTRVSSFVYVSFGTSFFPRCVSVVPTLGFFTFH